MNKPYIICHMMTSVDGRIDCGMTAKLRGVNEYYETLSMLHTPSTVSGRVTAELEMHYRESLSVKHMKLMAKMAIPVRLVLKAMTLSWTQRAHCFGTQLEMKSHC